MLKKLTALLLMLLLPAAALAEVYEGTTAALSAVSVTAEAAGTAEALPCRVGDRVAEGDALAALRPEKAFAEQDGTVSIVHVREGETADGAVLELAPLEQYLIYCTVDSAYQSAESTLVHSGEAVYIRCTTDGSHRALGVVTEIDGAEYRVLTLGGALYVGETVYLYRDADFTAALRVGIGTVVSSDPLPYEASGEVTRLRVEAGDAVERGQLLYEIGGGSVSAPVSGILTRLDIRCGDAVAKDQVVAELVPDGQVCVEIHVDEADANGISVGDSAALTPAGGDEADAIPGTVIDSEWVAEDGAYTVRVLPEAGTALPLGLSVTVRL